MNKYILGAVAVGLLLPFFASAQSIDQLRAQIEELLARIDALQGLQQPGVPITGVQPPVPVPAAATCPHISRSLRMGSTGDDVARLQQFLALDPAIYPERIVSGYYGALTEAAVKRFQCKNKIVCDGTPESTGYGVTGPRTAALLALQCSGAGDGGTDVGGFIKVTPINGAAPLQVVVDATVNTTRSCTGAVYEVDFGDGTPALPIRVPQGVCAETRQVFNHTYVGGGTFVVSLRSGVHRTTATVTVSGAPVQVGPGGESFSANTTSGTAPFSVTFSGVVNAAGGCNAGPYRILFGDGETITLPLSGCAPSSYTVTHIYNSGGTVTAQLTRGAQGTIIGSVQLNIAANTSGDAGQYFAVSPSVSGDETSVLAQFEISSPCTRFDLDWGDGSAHVTQAQGSCSGGTTSKEYTHDYASGGSYTVTLRRGTDLSATDSASITISN